MLRENNKSIADTLRSTPSIEEMGEQATVSVTNLVPAPAKWNFFAPLDDDKMDELVASVMTVGLMHDIVVRALPDSKYMVLSGHNRWKAYLIAYDKTHDRKYLSIPAHILRNITDDVAKQIVIDTNWVQRILSPLEKAKSIYEKYVSIQNTREKAKYGESNRQTIFDLVAQNYNIGSRMVQRYYRINFLEEPFRNMLLSGVIDLKSAEKLANLDKDTQLWIYTNYSADINNKTLNKISATSTRDEIKKIFEVSRTDHSGMYLYKAWIPNDMRSEFESYIQSFFQKKSQG